MKEIESFLIYLSVLLVSLILLYGLASLFIKFSPAPVNSWISSLVKRSTPSGWAISA